MITPTNQQGADPGQPAADIADEMESYARRHGIENGDGLAIMGWAHRLRTPVVKDSLTPAPIPAAPAAPVENPLAEKLQEVSTKMVIYEGIIREALEHLRIGHPGWDCKARRALEKSGVVVWPDVPAGASDPGSASTGPTEAQS